MAIETIPGQIKHEERTYKMIADIEDVEGDREIGKEMLLWRLFGGSLNNDEL